MSGIAKTLSPFNRGPGHFLLGPHNVQRCNERITLLASLGLLAAGTLLARKYTPVSAVKASGANTGNGTSVLDASPVLAGAKPGIYKVRFTTTTNIRLEDPDGVVLSDQTIGGSTGNSATVSEQIKTLITQGATPFAAGDGFDITVTGGNYGVYAPAAADGLQIFQGILWEDREDKAATQLAVRTFREVTVNAWSLVGFSDLDTNGKAALIAAAAKMNIVILSA